MHKPELYARVNHLQRYDVNKLSNEFYNEISNMLGRCLDIGSGPGDVAVDFILPKLNPNSTLLCSDVSEAMVKYGKEKHRDGEHINFVKLNIESPDLPEDMMQQFDHITSFYCINWCRNFRQVFENIFKILRPGGTTLLSIVAKAPALNAYKILATMPRYRSYMKDADRFVPIFQLVERSRETLEAIIKDVSFEIHHSSLRAKSWIFNNSDGFLDFMLALDPFIDRIPDDLKEDYKKDLVSQAAGQNIVFNKNANNENEYSVLFGYHTFVLYLRKPPTN